MFAYEKRLQYPVKIKNTNPDIAKLVISQYGGPDGEMSASMRYLSQRYTMPVKKVGGLLTDIGTEELNHLEIICAIVYQLTRDLTEEQVKAETSRCLGCGASVVDPNKCIGCGICTTKCVFDAISLHRELPGCSTMVKSEDKLKYVLPNMIKQSMKIKFKKGK